MKEFNFERKGIKFKFKNPELNEYNNLVLDWKIEKIKENNHNEDGYFYNAEFNIDEKAMIFYPVTINNNKIKGVRLPENMYESLLKIQEDFIKKRNDEIESIIDNIVNDNMPISFYIDGKYVFHYQPTICNIPEDLKSFKHKIMTDAVCKYLQVKYLDDAVCDYLKKQLNQNITTVENINNKAFELKVYDNKDHEYYGCEENIVTNFQMYLSDIINDKEVIKIREKRKKEIKEKEETEKRRNSFNMRILKEGKTGGSNEEGPDYYAIVELTDPSTNESLTFNCRNIFDVGYVINPEYKIAEGISGGLIIDNQWHEFKEGKGWYPIRKLTEFENRCIDYLSEFPPIYTGVRL